MSKKLRAPSGTDSWGSRRAAPHLGMGHVPVAVAPKHFHRLVVWDLGHNSLQKCHCMESLGVSLAFRAFLSSCSWWVWAKSRAIQGERREWSKWEDAAPLKTGRVCLRNLRP